ncbi:MAG: hypothetical protein HZA93_08225 [Verrucomicrobia bacterium]|nr:hypothetical protein [Verrucomicrobiota bacterium]
MALTSRVHTSWQLLQSSLRVLRERPRLIVFPAVAGFCLFALAVFFFAPFLLIRLGRLNPDMSAASQNLAPAFYAWGGVVYLGAMFLATFCNVAFYHETLRAFAGEEVSLRRGWQFAFGRIGAILCWSLLAGTVGLIIKSIEGRFGWLGKLVTGLVGTAWSVAAVFAVPVIVRRRDNNPLAVLRDSAVMLRRTWGETLVGFVGLQLGGLMLLGALLVTALAVVALSPVLHLGGFPRALFAAGMLLGLAVVGGLVAVATDVFRCALYVYASEGVVPQSYTPELLNTGWKVKKP